MRGPVLARFLLAIVPKRKSGTSRDGSRTGTRAAQLTRGTGTSAARSMRGSSRRHDQSQWWAACSSEPGFGVAEEAGLRGGCHLVLCLREQGCELGLAGGEFGGAFRRGPGGVLGLRVAVGTGGQLQLGAELAVRCGWHARTLPSAAARTSLRRQSVPAMSDRGIETPTRPRHRSRQCSRGQSLPVHIVAAAAASSRDRTRELRQARVTARLVFGGSVGGWALWRDPGAVDAGHGWGSPLELTGSVRATRLQGSEHGPPAQDPRPAHGPPKALPAPPSSRRLRPVRRPYRARRDRAAPRTRRVASVPSIGRERGRATGEYGTSP